MPTGRCISLTAAILALAACRVDTASENAPAPAPANNQAQAQIIPTPEQPLDRAGLLLAVVRARSASAAGIDDAAAQAELHGTRFEFRVRLGCTIGAPDSNSDVTYDPATRRVQIRVGPDLSLSDPAVQAAAGERYEAAEGLWIADPWLLVPSCAGTEPRPEPVAQPEQPLPKQKQSDRVEEEKEVMPAPPRAGRVGLAQFFTPQDPRSARRDGRPYAAQATLPEGSPPPEPGSWELVLTGRLQALPDGRVIACTAAGAGQQPACIVSVRIDRVAIDHRGTGARLADWSAG